MGGREAFVEANLSFTALFASHSAFNPPLPPQALSRPALLLNLSHFTWFNLKIRDRPE